MSVRALTLDAAGTLIEVAEPVGETYARIAWRHGISVVPAEVEGRFRAALAVAPPLAFAGVSAVGLRAREREWWRAVVRAALGAPPSVPAFDRCFDELFRHYASGAAWHVFPEVPAALAALRARGLVLAVVSNFDSRLAPLLTDLGIASLVDHVFVSSTVGYAKPDPTIFRVACTTLGVSPRMTVHTGDSAALDVSGALAAGLGAVLVDRGALRPALPSGARAITTLAELETLVLHP
jgi:putative hydrolase of the HAD superfamily